MTSGGIAVSIRAPTGEAHGRLAAAHVRSPTPDEMTRVSEPLSWIQLPRPLVSLLGAADTWLLGKTNKVTVCQRAAYVAPGAIGRGPSLLKGRDTLHFSFV